VLPRGKSPRHFKEAKPELLKDKEIVSRRIAAEALGLTERTLDRRVAEGSLTPIGEGHYKRFKTRDILRILHQKKSDKVDKTGQE
jgi:hypothetical protein